MLIELSEEELAVINLWYAVDAGESGYVKEDWKLEKQVILKLGFDIHPMDVGRDEETGRCAGE